MTDQTTPLRDRIAAAIRDAACTGDCGETEEECAKERIQPFAWHHGRLAVVEGSPEQIADAVLAVLPSAADWDALVREADRLRRDGAALHARAEGIDKQLAALRQQVAAPVDRGAVLREAADAVFALEYDVMVGEEGDENLGSMREAWDVGTIHASQLLRRMADETATTETQAVVPVCICGHPESRHFEDVCQTCGCGDYLEPRDAAEVIDRWRQAALKARAEAEAQQEVAVDTLARLMCDADVHVNNGDYPGWDDLSKTPGLGQDEVRKAARYLLKRLHITERQPAAGARQDGAQPEPAPEPYAGDHRECLACSHDMESHIRVNGEIVCAFEDCSDPTPGDHLAWPYRDGAQ